MNSFVINFGDGDGQTGIREMNATAPGTYPAWEESNGAWYSLDGRKLNGKPTAKGLYIHNGKKVAIK